MKIKPRHCEYNTKQKKFERTGIDLLYVSLLSHNLLSWHPWGNHICQVRSLKKEQMYKFYQ